MKVALVIVVVVLLVFGLAIGGKLMNVRNQLVTERESISAQWAQVDVALNRRADLIPSLLFFEALL
jgi:LemA protein